MVRSRREKLHLRDYEISVVEGGIVEMDEDIVVA